MSRNIDLSKWKSFKLSELFEIETGAICQNKDLKQGKTPRISVKGVNNGIQGYFCDIANKNYRVQENFISFSFLGTCFYHPYKASLDMKVHSLKPKNHTLNRYSGLFLVNIFKNSFKGVFANQISSSDLKQESILLPVNAKNEPDWDFMQEYIKQSQNELLNLIKLYERLLNTSGGGDYYLIALLLCLKIIKLNILRKLKISFARLLCK